MGRGGGGVVFCLVFFFFNICIIFEIFSNDICGKKGMCACCIASNYNVETSFVSVSFPTSMPLWELSWPLLDSSELSVTGLQRQAKLKQSGFLF